MHALHTVLSASPRRTALIALAAILLGGCGGDSRQALDALPTAAQITQQQSGADVLAPDWQGQSVTELARRGERLWHQCASCHRLGSGAANGTGPALRDIVGKPVGQAAGFAYSDAMQGARFVWSQQALDAWLARPWRFLPGTSMQYGGLSKAQDRLALIAYLQQAGE